MEEADVAAYLERWADAGFMFAFNLSGLPAMSVPGGLVSGNIPIGLQLIGRHGDEATILRVARQLEQQLDWASRKPPVMTEYNVSNTNPELKR
jgi:amidase